MSRRNAERAARRQREARSDAHARDMGIRLGVARALGIEERSSRSAVDHDTAVCDVFGCAQCIAIANGRAC